MTLLSTRGLMMSLCTKTYTDSYEIAKKRGSGFALEAATLAAKLSRNVKQLFLPSPPASHEECT